MPNIKSAKKRMVLSAAARLKNRATRSSIRTAVKRVRAADSPEAGESAFKAATILLDRAATKRLYHPNKVARIKSQLARHVQSMGA